jgi:hypothetical protein
MKAISLPLVLYQEFAKLIPQSILGLPDDSKKIFQKKKRNQSGKNSEVRIQKSKAEPLRD